MQTMLTGLTQNRLRPQLAQLARFHGHDNPMQHHRVVIGDDERDRMAGRGHDKGNAICRSTPAGELFTAQEAAQLANAFPQRERAEHRPQLMPYRRS